MSDNPDKTDTAIVLGKKTVASNRFIPKYHCFSLIFVLMEEHFHHMF